MAAFRFSVGDPITLWVHDRPAASSLIPVTELQKGLSAIGVIPELRSLPELEPFELLLTKKVESPSVPRNRVPGKPFGVDEFLIECTDSSVFLASSALRAFCYSIWEWMEWLGWSWPTPQITREPEARDWVFPAGQRRFRPSMKYRILFAEQIELSRECVLWLSRQRYNTLFPSNPARFADPENQFPDASLAVAEGLGFDIVVGGEGCAWLVGDFGPGERTSWKTLSREQEKTALARVREYWSEMGTPLPRFSAWPENDTRNGVERFLALLVREMPDLEIETAAGVSVPREAVPRTLFHLRDEDLPPTAPPEEIERWFARKTPLLRERTCYLLSDPPGWDRRLGSAVSPLLWRRQTDRLRRAAESGFEGAAYSIKNLETRSFMERSGFSVAVFGRMMWNGPAWQPDPFVITQLRDQFEGAAEVVKSLINDVERWVSRSELDAPPNDSAGFFRFAVRILEDETVRDKLDQRISEIEESAPCEACIELVRALSTLVGLFDLEECSDRHEAKALALTIWKKNQMDLWPAWLQASSPLAERLRGFF